MRKYRLLLIISFGPIDTGQNGYFIRMRNLLEVLSRMAERIVVLEYTEDSNTRPVRACLNAICIAVRGNETLQIPKPFKYIRLALYQLLNMIRYGRIIRRADAVLTASLLLLPTHILVRIANTYAVLLAEPHMFLAERLERKGNKIGATLLRIAERLYLSTSDAVIAISPEAAVKIKGYYGSTRPRILVVPFLPSRDLREKMPQCRATRGKACRTIFFIGDLAAPQNQDAVRYLLRVLAVAKKATGHAPSLLVVGRAPPSVEHAIRKEARKLGLQQEVKLLGYVEDPDLYACNSDILVAPMFTMSGVSTKMLYYLRFRGKPIIVSKEAAEGLWRLIRLHDNVRVAETPSVFAKMLIEACEDEAIHKSSN